MHFFLQINSVFLLTDILQVIADMDTNSRVNNKSGTYKSELLIGELTRLANDSYSINWGIPV